MNEEDKTHKVNPSASEDKTIQSDIAALNLPAQNSQDGSTIIKDSNETRMGDAPDMELLSLGAKLVILSKQNQGQEFYLTSQELILGRSEDCSLKMDYPGVSRTHVRITYENKSFFAEDLGSKYGTFAGKKKMEGKTKLKSGDLIQIGELSLKFVMGDEAPASKPKMLFVGIGIMVIIVFGLLMFKLSGTSTQPVQPSQPIPVARTTAPASDQSRNEIVTAKNLMSAGKLQDAMEKTALILQSDPLNQEALNLQKNIQSRMDVSFKLDNAAKLIEIGSFEQAKMLINDVLSIDSGNFNAHELLKRIEKMSKSQASFALLKDVKSLLAGGDTQGAKDLLSQIKDPSLARELEEVSEQIKSAQATAQILDEAQKIYITGDLTATLQKLRESQQSASGSEKLKQFRLKVEQLLAARKEADQLLGGPSPFKAKAALVNIVETAGENTPFGKIAAVELAELDSKALILAQLSYQEALRHYADGELKLAIEQIDQLCQNYSHIEYFKEIKNEIKVRVDNIAKALFRAAYVLEEKDVMKAKEILQRILTYLPENHIYAKKVRNRIR